MKRGDIFEHKRKRNDQGLPLLCEVTAVMRGRVYWRVSGDDGGAVFWFPLDRSEDYARMNEEGG